MESSTVMNETSPPQPQPLQSDHHDGKRDASGDGSDENDWLLTLTPPRSGTESCRDSLLAIFDRPVFQILGAIVMLLVIIDGALFFFLLIGAHRLCDEPSKTDCQPRNDVYNASIQVLNVLFTYMVTVSFPWRIANYLHTMGWSHPRRDNTLGCNLYGIQQLSPENAPNNDIWFAIPLARRHGILILLLLNVVTQYANQVTRGIYYNFEKQNVFPGNIWTNVFFAASFIAAGIGAGWLLHEMSRVRKQYPKDFFPPGPIEAAHELIVSQGLDRFMPFCCIRCCGIDKFKATKNDETQQTNPVPSDMEEANNTHAGIGNHETGGTDSSGPEAVPHSQSRSASVLVQGSTSSTALQPSHGPSNSRRASTGSLTPHSPTHTPHRESVIAGTNRNTMRLFAM
jgi:endogenous inhibitor of DNA gyrase (YacG/DUF329 family)